MEITTHQPTMPTPTAELVTRVPRCLRPWRRHLARALRELTTRPQHWHVYDRYREQDPEDIGPVRLRLDKELADLLDHVRSLIGEVPDAIPLRFPDPDTARAMRRQYPELIARHPSNRHYHVVHTRRGRVETVLQLAHAYGVDRAREARPHPTRRQPSGEPCIAVPAPSNHAVTAALHCARALGYPAAA